MDERTGSEWKPNVVTPDKWTNVMLIFSDHLGITKDLFFSDKILAILLENSSNKKKLITKFQVFNFYSDGIHNSEIDRNRNGLSPTTVKELSMEHII
jgi:hypothetical protein